MKPTARSILILPLALLLCACATSAENYAPIAANESPEPAHVFSPAELDQMLAPIALYPDSLLSQILEAATYPLEVVQAARWSRAHPGLKGKQAVEAVAGQDWDASVKSLVAFPQVLQMMDKKLEWMQDLGDAFLAQPTQVMDTVQNLRRIAYDAGNLRSNEHYRVERRGENIVIEPATADVVYVPYYDPRVVYGSWWRAGYPPVYWAPWPGYHPYAGTGFHWSVGIFVGPRFFFGFWDWPHRHVIVVHKHFVHKHPRHKHAHKIRRHDPHHRHGLKHRDPLIGKLFAPPHLRLDPDARRDLEKRHATPHERRLLRERLGKNHGQFGRHFRERGDIVRPGLGRLGPRHDRLTARPQLFDQRRFLAPRLRPQVQSAPRLSQRRIGPRTHSGTVPRAPKARALRSPNPTSRAVTRPSFSTPRPFNGFRQ